MTHRTYRRTRAVFAIALCACLATPALAQTDPGAAPSRDTPSRETPSRDGSPSRPSQPSSGFFPQVLRTLQAVKARQDAERQRKAAEDDARTRQQQALDAARAMDTAPQPTTPEPSATPLRETPKPTPPRPKPRVVAHKPVLNIVPRPRPEPPADTPSAPQATATAEPQSPPSARIPIAKVAPTPVIAAATTPEPASPTLLWIALALLLFTVPTAAYAIRKWFFAPALLPAVKAFADKGTATEPVFETTGPAFAFVIAPQAFATTLDYPGPAE